jgi:hypothetical protein
MVKDKDEDLKYFFKNKFIEGEKKVFMIKIKNTIKAREKIKAGIN